jgi:hypothetical protein
MAQEAPLFQAAESQWPEGASLHHDTAPAPPPLRETPRDRRLLWGALGLAAMAIAIGAAAFARRQGWLD